MNARRTLGRFFERMGRSVMAVLDVSTHEPPHWVVANEGRGLDFALEIFVSGSRRKDHGHNVERYARLGIRESFIFDRGRLRRSKGDGSAYQPIVPQRGLYPSAVLGLDLMLEGERLRFFLGDAEVPEAEELIAKLEKMLTQLELRVSQAEQRAREEARLRQEEARLREEEAEHRKLAEQRLERALAELEALKRRR
jgi:hypothetical protein